MAIAKVILNGETLMDVTSDTATANNMLSGIQATKNDGTKVTGNIASKSSTDLTVSGATVTAPAGYYANAASKAVATTTHPNPTASITSSTGVVTASHTQTTGYVTSGTTTGTLSLTTQAGKTVTPTETAQTAVASYRWTTGPVSVAAISSTYVGSGIPTRSAADMTVAAQSVTAPAGYYSQAFTKAVTVTTHPNPTAAITSSTGVITATHTQTAGYVAAGTTTGTTQLTSKAAATIYPSTADQTIASYHWLTGTQTIKSVTTSNLTAENIAEGVVIKIGDSSNASRITQVTGTHSGASSYTATITSSGHSSYCYVTYNGTKYYTNNNTFTFKAGDTLQIYAGTRGGSNDDTIYINGILVKTANPASYTYTLPVGDITIDLSYLEKGSSVNIWGLVQPTGTYSVSAAGTHNIYSYSTVSVAAGSAFPPAVTITKAPTFSMNSSTGVITASYTGSSSITPTVTSGYISQGTAGTISTTGTSTYTLTTQGAQTITPGSTAQTIASNRWLTGTQTIAGDSNLVAANIAEGVSIFGITGTYSAAGGFTADQIALRTIAGDISGNASIIGSYTFAYCSSLTTVSFPACVTICNNAFYSCSNLTTTSFSSCISIYSSAFHGCHTLTTISFPVCRTIGLYAFGYCSSLTIANFPSCTIISGSAFTNCINLTTINFPVCTSIGYSAFYYCSKITIASFPSCTTISTSAFAYCSSLTTISFPVCRTIGSNAFYACYSLTTISFPSCTTIYSQAFGHCGDLTTASFPSCMTISTYAFIYCYNFLSLYLLGSSIPTLVNVNAFSSTPISNYTTSTGGVYGSIYVPASLYNDYLTATNWSLYSARIVSV